MSRSTARSSAIFLTALSVVSQVLGFCYRVGLSRVVGAEVMGLYQLVMPVYSVLMSVVSVGLTAAVATLSARYLALGQDNVARRTVGVALGIFVWLMLPVAAVVLVLYDPISVCLLGDARTQLALILLLPCVALTAVENIHKHYFYGIGRVRPPAIIELTEQVIRAGAVLGLLLVFLPQNPERTVGVIVLGMIVCEVFSALALVVLFGRRTGCTRTERGPEVRTVISIAWPVALTALLGNVMGAANAAVVPRMLIGGMTREQAVSAFGVVSGMTLPMLSVPTLFLGALNLVMMPRVARYCALGQRERTKGVVGRALTVVCVTIQPCMALLCAVGPELGRLLFGREDVGRYLPLLAAAVACGAVQSVLSGVLNGGGRQGTAATIALVCDVVQLGTTLLVMGRPGGGLEGFAAALAVSGVLGVLLCDWAVRRRMGVQTKLLRLAALPALGAVLAGQTARLLLERLRSAGMDGWPAVTVTLLFGGAVYVAALHALGVRPGFLRRAGKKKIDK
ncbi:MAG: stage V sporulation protein B [Ruminococcaceae bacterium]|nr:stage V sporulation protein B [Oscillospiraceae bacterium]